MNLFKTSKEFLGLKKSFKLSYDELVMKQHLSVRNIVSIAYEKSEYYKQLFDSIQFHPSDMTFDFKKFFRIPILTKNKLRDLDIKQIINTDYQNLQMLSFHPTSGSTGIPLKIYMTKADSERNDLCHVRSYLYNKWKIFDKIVSIIGDVDYRDPNTLQHFGIMPIKYISINQPVASIVEDIMRSRFDILKGYTDDLRLISKYILDKDIKSIRPKIVSTGAALLDDITRELIHKAFKVYPTDSYGSADAGQIAWQCNKREYYHINIDMVFVEVIRNNHHVPIGEPGEIVITNLWNTAFPIIRFKLGDIVTLHEGKCDCGLMFPCLKMIDGKTVDFIILPNGEAVTPHAPKQVMIDVLEVDAYKIIQTSEFDIVVKVIPKPSFNIDVSNRIISKLNILFKNELSIKVEAVNDLPRNEARKFNTVESKIGQEYFTKTLIN